MIIRSFPYSALFIGDAPTLSFLMALISLAKLPFLRNAIHFPPDFLAKNPSCDHNRLKLEEVEEEEEKEGVKGRGVGEWFSRISCVLELALGGASGHFNFLIFILQYTRIYGN